MHEFIFSGISLKRYAIFYRKNDSKKYIQKPVFKIENRISGFQLTSIPLLQLVACFLIFKFPNGISHSKLLYSFFTSV